MLKNIFLVLLGGGIGSVARYFLSYLLTKNNTTQFPWATFIANALGCLLIGLLFGYIQKNNLQNELINILKPLLLEEENIFANIFLVKKNHKIA